MTIKKVESKWLVDLYPNGRVGKRVRKKFDTRLEAQRFEKYVLNAAHSSKGWNEGAQDRRTLTDLIECWYGASGLHLKDGIRRKRCLNDIAMFLGNPAAKSLKPSEFIVYMQHKKEEGCSEKTINNHLGYMNAVFNCLKDIGEIVYPNPLSKIKMIKIDERELSWLTKEEILHLLNTIETFNQNPHVLLVTKVCLATGARWGEAEGLKLRNVRDGKVTFNGTKSGRSRSVPVDNELFDELVFHLKTHSEFSSSIGAFRRALAKSGIELPRGQAAHVLRHSFASHFMMNGGSILTLQKIMGHSSISMTMRYAHLSPDHLKDAVTHNPLAKSNTNKE